MVNKAQLLFRSREGQRQQLSEAIAQELDRLFQLVNAQQGGRVIAMQLLNGFAEQTPHGRAMGGQAFDASLEVGYEEAPLEDLIALCGGIGERLNSSAHLELSYALVGTEYVFSPGETDTVLLIAISRPLWMSYEEHHRHWLNRHGWLVKPGSDRRGSGYRQFHADPKASSFAARNAGLGRHEFEGVASGYHTNPDTYLDAMSQTSALSRVYEDERQFIDFSTSCVGLYQTVGARRQEVT